MQIPSVGVMFQSKVSQIGSRVPASALGFLGDFAGEYASALGDAGTQETGAVTDLTIEPGDPTAQTQSPRSLLYSPSGVGRASTGLPLFIPAAAAGAYDVQAVAGSALTVGSALAAALQTAEGSALAEQVVAFAKQFVGTPYVAGGEDLVKGTDCSGFTQSVYKQFGITLPRSSYRQSMVGEEVSPDDLRPGDLMFFKTADYAPVTHVAMYIGDGKIVHASSKKTGVIISNLKKNWRTDDFVIARRLLP